ncbi:MAG: hypothetical protein OWR62_10545 [Sulfobacillus thermotolerans]|uniref:Hemerythrin-like domain-containing protein n=1 Tax=Sulfobacillus thermotolerans TaxID=338644 RepID=A0ABM6RU59_9FIRM|nr:hypothetical protein BXT84_13940 [Sulfobacillus thermotolerans]MCY0908815.1 hypothetical protein [Sulfobacillus thermotolerans]
MSISCGLEQLAAHQAIHTSVTADLDAAMRLLHVSMRSGSHNEAYELAGVIVTIWTERELWHVHTEEAALYRHIPAMAPLQRDHDLMEQWVCEARSALEREGQVSAFVLSRLEALAALLHTHNQEELRQLRLSLHDPL